LKPTPEQSLALLETVEQFTVSFNHVCETGWRLREGNAYKLHHATYRICKDGNSLVSDLHIQARQKASEAVKSAIALQKKGRNVSQPKSAFCSPRFNSHTFKLNWEANVAILSTTQGRQKMSFKLPPYAAHAVGCKTTTADLIRKKGKWYLHVVMKLPDIEFQSNGQTIGVDLGVSRPAVTSDNRFHGKRHWKEVEKRTFRLKRALQAKGSKSAKKHLRRLAGKQRLFRRDCDHVLSKNILKGVNAGTTVVIENLTDIRKSAKMRRGEAKRRLHAWSFAQLRYFLTYKAENIGVCVTAIDPRHTSQRCNECGYTSRSNRRCQSDFQCRECGHKHNADLNAAKNIRDKHLVGWTKSSSSVLPSISISSQPSG